VIRTPEHEVVQFDGPVLELMTDSRTRFDQRLAALGPDIVADDFDEREFLRRLRAGDHTRGIADALLDQRILSGIGNMWKSEGCHLAGIDPWRPVGEVSDADALSIVDAVRPLMRRSAEGGRIASYRPDEPLRPRERRTWVFERAGLPCRTCGTLVRARGQGDDNRTSYWCPSCQT
jgi:endonuclease VIII